jgi:hypothetical protein
MGTVTGKWSNSIPSGTAFAIRAGTRCAPSIAAARSGAFRPGRYWGIGWSETGPRAKSAYVRTTSRLTSTVTRSGPLPAANSPSSPRTYVSEPPMRPGMSVSSAKPMYTGAGC